MIKRLFSIKGQGAVEAVLTLPLMILVGGLLFSLVYRGLVFYFASYQLHEALICTESQRLFVCQKELQKRIDFILMNGATAQVSLTKNSTRAHGQILISLNPPMEIEKTLRGSLL